MTVSHDDARTLMARMDAYTKQPPFIFTVTLVSIHLTHSRALTHCCDVSPVTNTSLNTIVLMNRYHSVRWIQWRRYHHYHRQLIVQDYSSLALLIR
jgi:hypothetical protein